MEGWFLTYRSPGCEVSRHSGLHCLTTSLFKSDKRKIRFDDSRQHARPAGQKLRRPSNSNRHRIVVASSSVQSGGYLRVARLALGFFSPDLPVCAIIWAMQHSQRLQSQTHVRDLLRQAKMTDKSA